MKGKQEVFLGIGKLFVPASREKIIAFEAYHIIIKRAKYGLNTMNCFMNLEGKNWYGLNRIYNERVTAVIALRYTTWRFF
jgi:hypothetical protein